MVLIGVTYRVAGFLVFHTGCVCMMARLFPVNFLLAIWNTIWWCFVTVLVVLVTRYIRPLLANLSQSCVMSDVMLEDCLLTFQLPQMIQCCWLRRYSPGLCIARPYKNSRVMCVSLDVLCNTNKYDV